MQQQGVCVWGGGKLESFVVFYYSEELITNIILHLQHFIFMYLDVCTVHCEELYYIRPQNAQYILAITSFYSTATCIDCVHHP
jgi:hypothetical protein